MSIGIILNSPQDIPLVHWAKLFARSRQEPLVMLWAAYRRGSKSDRETTRSGAAIPEELTELFQSLTAEGFHLALDQDGSDNDDDSAGSAGLLMELVERIQGSSLWDFDFVALISLSTLIAAGGLIQNSPAVVIGAMLVAPLMTPLLGTGLSLIQGNSILCITTLSTVARGFLLAFFLGWLVGCLVPSVSVNSELAARGSPRILDLFVALFSGIAAAYANGRPNLFSALPGVAIAASLVPPIATSGLATRMGEFTLAGGAALLFITNIIAIVLGTAISFWAVGIRSSHKHSAFNRWSLGAGAVLVLMTMGLGIYEAWPTRQMSVGVVEQVAREHDLSEVDCTRIRRSRIAGQRGVEIHLISPAPVSKAVLDAMQQKVREKFPHAKRVRIRTELIRNYERLEIHLHHRQPSHAVRIR